MSFFSCTKFAFLVFFWFFIKISRREKAFFAKNAVFYNFFIKNIFGKAKRKKNAFKRFFARGKEFCGFFEQKREKFSHENFLKRSFCKKLLQKWKDCKKNPSRQRTRVLICFAQIYNNLVFKRLAKLSNSSKELYWMINTPLDIFFP